MALAMGLGLALGPLGCASIQSDYIARPFDSRGQLSSGDATPSGLIISGEELDAYASDLFGLVEVTFENTSTEWLRVEQLELDFGSELNPMVHLPEGADLEAWYAATLQRNSIRNTNYATALAALFLVGEAVAVAGALSDEREVQVAGTALALGAASVAVIDEHVERVQRPGRVRPITQNHLLAAPFAVPPGLFTKKWVLLNTRADAACVRSMVIHYELESRGRERVVLTFRRGNDGSDWQERVCYNEALGASPYSSWGRSVD